MKQAIDCTNIKGANYTPSYASNPISFWRDYQPQTVEKELMYAKNLGFNCIRVFLCYVVYENDPQKYLDNVDHLIQSAKALGINTMLVVFDACFSREEPVFDWSENEWIPNPGCMNLEEHFWDKGDKYCMDLLKRFGNEDAVTFWDVMNEPEGSYIITKEKGDTYLRNLDITYRFVNHYTDLLKKAEPCGAITVGSCNARSNENLEKYGIIEKLDVISFHDYSHDEKSIQKNYDITLGFGKKYNKPVLATEIGCPARANPYDRAIEAAMRNKVGFFLWELMIGCSFWNDRHGVVYPNGTIRDTALVAALYGHFVNRDPDAVRYNGNTEGLASIFVDQAMQLLADETTAFDVYAEMLERFANLLESNGNLPLTPLPTACARSIIKSQSVSAAKEQLRMWIDATKNAYRLT